MKVLAEMDHISLKYGQKEILKDITWKIAENEHWAVFGLNGSGKTTLLNILTGYQSQSDGIVKFSGYSYSKENILTLRQEIGYVSSSFWDKYYCNEAILDIVLGSLSGAFGRTPATQDRMVVAAKKMLDQFGLRNCYYRLYTNFSKGERQKVLLARAFLQEPKLLVLDEPCSGLDVKGRTYFLELVEQIAQDSRTTIVYVTHYLEEILPSFQKMLFLDNGKIYTQGDRQDIAQQIKRFLESVDNKISFK